MNRALSSLLLGLCVLTSGLEASLPVLKIPVRKIDDLFSDEKWPPPKSRTDRGKKGPRGAEGKKGSKGVQGARGARGKDGSRGPMGRQGPKGERGPQGVAGPRGETGPAGGRGLQGERGDTGPIGATGARGEKGRRGEAGLQGPRGDSGEVFIGMAYGSEKNTASQIVHIPTQSPITSTKLCPAPLFNGYPQAPATSSPFEFSPYVANADPVLATPGYFAIHPDGGGRYVLQYTLSGVPSAQLLSDFITVSGQTMEPRGSLWIAVQVMREDSSLLLGAVPLTLTHTLNNGDSDAAAWFFTGFGQSFAELQDGDKVTLQIFLGTTTEEAISKVLTISPKNILLPSGLARGKPLSQGATLTLTRIGPSPARPEEVIGEAKTKGVLRLPRKTPPKGGEGDGA